MKNKEKFANEIAELACEGFPFAVENGVPVRCQHCERCDLYDAVGSGNCNQARRGWGEAEYVEPAPEPEIDWSKVTVNTPILVKNNLDDKWIPRYFAKYQNGKVYAWDDGRTSWTTERFCKWDEVKLQKIDPVIVDWANVPIDTPIFVRSGDDKPWLKRHFCRYEDGVIYAWESGCASASQSIENPDDPMSSSSWKQAKLAF